ncbi:MAG: tRNA pseudouridine(38-40) synthase TruA [Ruminococcaceae bacterium]|nr:tRNA pseudouridine(38-40) synthase TruA [Oscillospiraceae bacterium]
MEGKILLTVAYLGTAYCGYQVQPNGITVQEMLGRAAKALFGYTCDVVGCSRTDSGVHARGFCVALSVKGENYLQTAIPPERIARALNAHLPDDIAVLRSQRVSGDFHPRYDVLSKEYEYLIYNGRERNPFLTDRAWHLPTLVDDEALKRMQAAAAYFVGKQDFSAFRAVGADTEPGDAVRTVYSASVERKGDMISFRVRADGFLYHMVRIMTGTLIAVARGRISPEQIPEIMQAKDRGKAGTTAPACGLYLDAVFYKNITP